MIDVHECLVFSVLRQLVRFCGDFSPNDLLCEHSLPLRLGPEPYASGRHTVS